MAPPASGVDRIRVWGAKILADESPPQTKNFFCPLYCRTWLLAHFQKKKLALYGISSGTDGQISWRVFHFSRHERACLCRHVKIGPGLLPIGSGISEYRAKRAKKCLTPLNLYLWYIKTEYSCNTFITMLCSATKLILYANSWACLAYPIIHLLDVGML